MDIPYIPHPHTQTKANEWKQVSSGLDSDVQIVGLHILGALRYNDAIVTNVVIQTFVFGLILPIP